MKLKELLYIYDFRNSINSDNSLLHPDDYDTKTVRIYITGEDLFWFEFGLLDCYGKDFKTYMINGVLNDDLLNKEVGRVEINEALGQLCIYTNS